MGEAIFFLDGSGIPDRGNYLASQLPLLMPLDSDVILKAGLLGDIMSSFCLFRLERRIRSLVHGVVPVWETLIVRHDEHMISYTARSC